jgi:hypothetical protein
MYNSVFQLSQEELQKQHERKEQNRRAAHKCRQKRKHKLEYFIMASLFLVHLSSH